MGLAQRNHSLARRADCPVLCAGLPTPHRMGPTVSSGFGETCGPAQRRGRETRAERGETNGPVFINPDPSGEANGSVGACPDPRFMSTGLGLRHFDPSAPASTYVGRLPKSQKTSEVLLLGADSMPTIRKGRSRRIVSLFLCPTRRRHGLRGLPCGALPAARRSGVARSMAGVGTAG